MHSLRTHRIRPRALRRSPLALATALVAVLSAAPAASAAFEFGPPAEYAAGELPVSAAIGDLNGDGRPDLAVANFSSSNVSVLLANPGGGYAPAVNYPTGGGAYSVAIGDLNADGRPDLAVANLGGNTAGVLLANPAGGFDPSVTYPVGDAASVVIGDLSGDGRPDLALSDAGGDAVSVLVAQPAGGFAPAVHHPVGDHPERIAIGDLNGDGRLDIAAATTEGVSVLVARPAGGFEVASTYGPSKVPVGVAIGDLTGDGRADLAVSNSDFSVPGDPLGEVIVLRGKADGGFAVAGTYPVGTVPHSVAIGDLNADGRPDLAAANYADQESGGVSILLANAAGGFAPERRVRAGRWHRTVAIGDLNADGRPDLALASDTPGAVRVLLNASTPAMGLSVSALAFGGQTVGTVSASKTVTVTNTGDAALHLSAASLAGTDAAAYAVTRDGCAAGPLPAGATCEVEVRFEPAAVGLATAELRIAGDAPGGARTVALRGVGVPRVIDPPAKDPVVTCRHRRAARGKVTVSCVVVATPAGADRAVTARLKRGKLTYASRRRVLRAGRGRLTLQFGRPVPRAKYLLTVELRDGDGRRTVIQRRLNLRK